MTNLVVCLNYTMIHLSMKNWENSLDSKCSVTLDFGFGLFEFGSKIVNSKRQGHLILSEPFCVLNEYFIQKLNPFLLRKSEIQHFPSFGKLRGLINHFGIDNK